MTPPELALHQCTCCDPGMNLLSRRNWRLVVLCSSLFLIATTALRAAEPFAFAAFGCMPYARYADSGPRLARLISEINRLSPAFTVHLGDIIGSDEDCSDELLKRRRDDFNTFDGPLIYTPGDNEWTDTHTEKAGSYDPLERLAKVRTLFFPDERSLGRRPMPLVTQRRDARFANYVENARWMRQGVVFATVHIVGSNNNHRPSAPAAMAEWRARDEANDAWIRAAFAEARQIDAPGVVLFFQANPFAADKGRPGYYSGFERNLKTLEAEASDYGKPVLLVHADEHRYRLDRGMRFTMDSPALPNVTRLETFGAGNLHAVLVTVDVESAEVFLAGPLIVPGNPLPRLPRAPVRN
jgi:hypothetical protein